MVKVITGDITTTADGEVALEVKVSYTQPNVDMPEVSDDWLWIGEVSSYTDLQVLYTYMNLMYITTMTSAHEQVRLHSSHMIMVAVGKVLY